MTFEMTKQELLDFIDRTAAVRVRDLPLKSHLSDPKHVQPFIGALNQEIFRRVKNRMKHDSMTKVDKPLASLGATDSRAKYGQSGHANC